MIKRTSIGRFIRFYTYITCLIHPLISFATGSGIAYNAPYSRYGIGEYNAPCFSQHLAIGGLSSSIRNLGGGYSINVSNPAQYSEIKLTCFETGFSFNNVRNSNTTSKEYDNGGKINYLAMAVPVSQKSGIAFGIMPYSAVGYKSSSVGQIEGTTDVISGSGSLSRLFVGYGHTLLKNISLGANVNYIFGTLINTESIEYQNTQSLSTAYNTTKKVNGLQVDFGTQYHKEISPKLALVVGYAIVVQSNLNVNETQILSRWYKSTESINLDSSYKNTTSLKFHLPTIHRLGVSIQNGKRYLVGSQIEYGQWSRFSSEFKDSYAVAIGGQMTPEVESNNYFNRIDYRMGFRFDKTYMNIMDNDILKFTYTLGLGLPLAVTRNSSSKLNLTFEYSRLGTVSNGLLLQEMFNVYFGFTLNDKWFIKTQFD